MIWMFIPLSLYFAVMWMHERYLYNYLIKKHVELNKKYIRLQKKYNKTQVGTK